MAESPGLAWSTIQASGGTWRTGTQQRRGTREGRRKRLRTRETWPRQLTVGIGPIQAKLDRGDAAEGTPSSAALSASHHQIPPDRPPDRGTQGWRTNKAIDEPSATSIHPPGSGTLNWPVAKLTNPCFGR